jgi:lipopolysaccharide transport system permease protein
MINNNNHSREHQIWTDEIKSEHNLFSINFKEIYHSRDLLFMFVKRDYTTFYKQTILGPFWFFIQPILTTLVYVILFGQIANLSTDGVPQSLFYLSGIVFWNYFSEVLTKTSSVLKENSNILGKVYFPRIIMPLSIVLSGLIKFGIQFILLSFLFIYHFFLGSINPTIYILFLPIIVLLIALLSFAIGLIFSALTAKYKDLIFLLTFGIQLGMYITPIAYPISSMPEKYMWIARLNPLSSLLEFTRYGFFGVGTFSSNDLLYSVGMIFLILILGVVIFNKIEKFFIDII